MIRHPCVNLTHGRPVKCACGHSHAGRCYACACKTPHLKHIDDGGMFVAGCIHCDWKDEYPGDQGS